LITLVIPNITNGFDLAGLDNGFSPFFFTHPVGLRTEWFFFSPSFSFSSPSIFCLPLFFFFFLSQTPEPDIATAHRRRRRHPATPLLHCQSPKQKAEGLLCGSDGLPHLIVSGDQIWGELPYLCKAFGIPFFKSHGSSLLVHRQATARAGSMHFGALGETLKWGLKKNFKFFLSFFFFFFNLNMLLHFRVKLCNHFN
jgi:hypothetical protein